VHAVVLLAHHDRIVAAAPLPHGKVNTTFELGEVVTAGGVPQGNDMGGIGHINDLDAIVEAARDDGIHAVAHLIRLHRIRHVQLAEAGLAIAGSVQCRDVTGVRHVDHLNAVIVRAGDDDVHLIIEDEARQVPRPVELEQVGVSQLAHGDELIRIGQFN
jgi:hypothetical protein